MKVLYTILLLLCFSPLLSQPRVQELHAQLVHAEDDAKKLEAYKSIVDAYETDKEDSAVFYATEGLHYFTTRHYKTGQAWMQAYLAEIDDDHGREEPARQGALYALGLFTEEKEAGGIAEVNNDLGTIEGKTGNFELALNYLMESLKSYESEGNSRGMMKVYSNLGITYERYKDTSKAIQYLKLADSIAGKLPLSDAVINVYNDIGAYYADRGDTTIALKYFEEGLIKSDKPQYLTAHLSCLMNTGMMYCRIGDDKKGIAYLEEALDIAKRKNFPEEEANILTNLAIAVGDKEGDKALTYLRDALDISRKMGNKPLQADIYNVMTEVYKSENDFKNAFDANEKRQALLDSIMSLNTAKEIAGIGAIHDLEKSSIKVKELELLNERNLHQRNIIIYVAGVAVIFLFIVAIFYRKTKVLNDRLVVHETELNHLNEMKNKLFSVIGHDLKTPMARIPIILDLIEDKESTEEEKKMLLDSMREHSKVSVETLDKLLFWGKSLVGGKSLNMAGFLPKQYITAAIEFKKDAAIEKNITIRDMTSPDLCGWADVTHFDFIMRNLLVNAIKYTRVGGAIEINADTGRKAGYILFWVKDNGVGMTTDRLSRLFEPLVSIPGTVNEQGTGIGLMLCKEFVKQNGGDIWAESEVGQGATFFFTVKSVN